MRKRDENPSFIDTSEHIIIYKHAKLRIFFSFFFFCIEQEGTISYNVKFLRYN